MNTVYGIVEAQNATFPVAVACLLLSISRASYYRWVDALPTKTALRHEELTREVKRVFDTSEGIFGHRMVHYTLREERIDVSVGTVAKIMATNGWYAKRMHAFKRTTVQDDDAKFFPDLLGRNFTSDTPGTVLYGDITYLRTGEGWLYLATVIDACTKQVVGWALSDRMTAPIVRDALQMAKTHGHMSDNAIYHSDRGSQYTSKLVTEWCTAHEVRQSMGHTGVCWDNAAAESFFSSLKNEFYHHYRFDTRQAARTAVVRYIEAFYNRYRPHSSVGGLAPVTVLENWRAQNLASRVAA